MKEGASMKELYRRLYNDFYTFPEFDSCAHFVSMCGELYDKGTRRFMLIGRSTNGWGTLNTASETAFGGAAQAEFDGHKRWNWAESIGGTLLHRQKAVLGLCKSNLVAVTGERTE